MKRTLKIDFDIDASQKSSNEIQQTMEIVQRDFDEKTQFIALNNRFANFFTHIEDLKQFNDQLEFDLKDEIFHWAFFSIDQQELRLFIDQLNQRTIERVLDEVQCRTDEQSIVVLHRLISTFAQIETFYRRRQDDFIGLVERHENEFHRVIEQQRLSDEELTNLHEELTEELTKFHQRLDDWNRLIIEKENLRDEIQSLRERRNFFNALNDEEINEWKRLLEQSTENSIEFYRDELTNAIRSIKKDYSQRTKFDQENFEGQLKFVEDQLKQFSFDSTEIEIDETKLRSNIEVFEHEQNRLNELRKILNDKRRLLNDEQTKFAQLQRTIEEKHFYEQIQLDRFRSEYEDFHQHFQEMALGLRFSLEDELRIYACLLNELMQKSSTNFNENEIQETFEGTASIFSPDFNLFD